MRPGQPTIFQTTAAAANRRGVVVVALWCVAVGCLLALPPSVAAALAPSPKGSYDAALPLGSYGDTAALATAAAAGAGGTNVADLNHTSGLPFHVGPFLDAALVQAGAVRTYALGVLPLCVAYNAPGANASGFSVTVGAFAAFLQGGAANFTDNQAVAPIGVVAVAADFTTVLLPFAASVPCAGAFLASMNRVAASVFTAAASYPAGVSGNAAVSFYSDEGAAATAVASTPWTIAVLSYPVAAQRGLSCLRFRFPASTYDQILSPSVSADTIASYSVNHAAPTVTPKTATTVAYPLVGPVVLYANQAFGCDATRSSDARRTAQTLHRIVTSQYPAIFSSIRGAVVASSDAYTDQLAMLSALCSPSRAVVTGGSSAIQAVVSAWSVAYQGVDAAAMVSYAGTGSGAGVSGVTAGTYVVGGSDVVLTPAQHAAKTTLVQIPVIGLALTLVFNLPQSCISLHLPRCALSSIFNGSITHWNDHRLEAVNPGLTLPAQPIKLVVRLDNSGSTAQFLSGLRTLEMQCFGASNIVPTESWSLAGTPTKVSGSGGIVNAVLASYYTLGYVAQSNAVASKVPYADLVDEATGSVAAVSTAALDSALASQATLNASTNEVVISANNPTTYVFIGTSYLIFDSRRAQNCTELRYALAMVKWAFTSAAAQAAARGLYYTPLPAALAAPLVAFLERAATCGGAALFPSASQASSPVAAAVAGAVGGGGGLLLIVALVKFRNHGQRDNSNAPKDASKPVAMVFTDIQSSTTLWSTVPEVMSEALDAHNEVLRRALEKHDGYEVKTIGDAFMVAFSSADDAVLFANDAQRMLFQHEWGTGAIDDVYADTAAENVPETPASVWNGLRVRVGVHVGLCDIHLDPTTKGYDYHGTLVNTAARVEDAGHGGQVVLTADALEALTADVRRGLVVTPLGPTTLRGLLEPVELFQVSLPMFVERAFPPLRTEKGGGGDGDEDDVVSAISGSRKDGDAETVSVSSAVDNRAYPVVASLETLLGPLKPKEKKDLLKRIATSHRLKIDENDAASSIHRLSSRVVKLLNAKNVALVRRQSRVSFMQASVRSADVTSNAPAPLRQNWSEKYAPSS